MERPQIDISLLDNLFLERRSRAFLPEERSAIETASAGLDVDFLLFLGRLGRLRLLGLSAFERIGNVVHLIDQSNVLAYFLIVQVCFSCILLPRMQHATVISLFLSLRIVNHLRCAINGRVFLQAAFLPVMRLILTHSVSMMHRCTSRSLLPQFCE